MSEIYQFYDPINHIVAKSNQSIYATYMDTIDKMVYKIQNKYRPF